MAGYVIHVAVAKEYLRKHKDIEEDEQEFIDGTIAPDLTDDKSKTHYGVASSETDLSYYLSENVVDNSFKRGYFLHLLVDRLFYNYYFDIKKIKREMNIKISDYIYDDYDKLNKVLIEKYQVVLPLELQKYVKIKDGKTKILDLNIVEKMIEEISDLDLNVVIDELKQYKYFNLKGRKII